MGEIERERDNIKSCQCQFSRIAASLPHVTLIEDYNYETVNMFFFSEIYFYINLSRKLVFYHYFLMEIVFVRSITIKKEIPTATHVAIKLFIFDRLEFIYRAHIDRILLMYKVC